MTNKLLPWLSPAMTQLRAAHRAGHLAHALLIHEARGAGGDVLAQWVAQLVLCTDTANAPCGVCLGCRRVAGSQHPDLVRLEILEDKKEIVVDQVRDLIETLILTSHQSGYKVAIVTPADALNRNAANAFLKTLEEPTPNTLIILVATQPSRLPATLLSRCQRIAARPAARSETLAWLQEVRGPGDWPTVLKTLGDAPLWAAEVDPKTVAEFAGETERVLNETVAGAADPAVTAERWWRTDLPLRLLCIENWLTERIHRHFKRADFSVEMPRNMHLQRGREVPNIRRLFGLVDAVHELKASLETSLNRSLALESLLRRLAAN